MNEFGRRFDDLYPGQESGNMIISSFDALNIKDYPNNNQTRIMIIGIIRLGREAIRSSVDKKGIHEIFCLFLRLGRLGNALAQIWYRSG